MRSDEDRLLDILEAIERIRRHTTTGRPAFDTNELIQNWVVHHLQIIGEAASRLSDEAIGAMPEVPWRGIVGMRNVLVHGYFDIDLDAVWTVVVRDLEPLESGVRRYLEPAEDSASPTESQATMADRASRFHQDMVVTVDTLKREINYYPARFAQMLGEYGGVGTTQRLLASDEYSEGFTKLWENDRLHMSVEASVLLPWYQDLFTSAERAAAERRLRDYGFDVEGFLDHAGRQPPDWAT